MAVEVADSQYSGIDALAPLARNERFETLYSRYYPMLVSTCTNLTRDRAAGEDVAQETLLRAYVHLEFLDEHRAWPWLKRVATNLVIDDSRKRKREVVGTDGNEDEMVVWPLDGGDDGGVLTEALSKLSRRQRIALALRYGEDWDPAEAAAFLDLGGSAFKQLLFRARRKLKDEYRKLSAEATLVALWPAALLRGRHGVVSRIRARLTRASGRSAIQPALGIGAALVVIGILAGSAPFRTGGTETPSASVPSMYGLTASHHAEAGKGAAWQLGSGVHIAGGRLAGRGPSGGAGGGCVASQAADAAASSQVGATALNLVGPGGSATLHAATTAGCRSTSGSGSPGVVAMASAIKMSGGLTGGATSAVAPGLMVAIKQAIAGGGPLPPGLAKQLPDLNLPANTQPKDDGKADDQQGQDSDQSSDDTGPGQGSDTDGG